MPRRTNLERAYKVNTILGFILWIPLVVLFEVVLETQLSTPLDYVIYLGVLIIFFNQKSIMIDRDREYLAQEKR